MKKKCFKKTVSWALSIVMSATMAVTPVLADTFTDDSQSIISGNAEIPAVDVESATDCGDVASTEENLTEPALLQEEEFDNPEHVEFSGGNDAEAVSEFSDDSVPAAQTEGNTVVYLDPKLGNNANDGKSDTTAIKTLGNALTMARGGTIYLLNPINIDEDVTLENVTLENVTLRPGRANLEYMLNVKADKKVTLKNVKINNLTPENSSCIFSENPIQVYGSGAGIFAKCLEKKTHMDVKISSGEIIGNYSGKEGNMQENAIMLSGMYNAQSSSKEIGLANLYLSGNPLIKGSVILSEYTDASQNSEGSCIYVKNDLSVNSPILVISATGTPGLTAVKYENETAPENYTSQFVSEKNGKVRLEKNGNTLQWASNKLVTFITYANITDKVLENAPKNVYVIPEDKIDSKDIPTAANIPGYERTGWQCISGESSNTWDPESQITEDMQVQEIWALKVPTVTIAKENGCPSSGIKLTAQAQHTCNDITYSYEWYKDNAPIDGQIEKTLTISEAGTYKVKVTATSPAKYQVSAEQSVAIPDTDFKHSYTWEHDQTTHWQYCSVGNENTTPEAHTFGDWTVTKQASIGVEGEKERTCTVCRYKETATIPAIYIPSYPVTGIKVSPDTLALTRKDETAQLTAEVIPSYADNTRVKWKSSDENVVTVDEKGKVTAVGNGTATITVTSVSGNYIATVAVTVKIPVEIEKISIEAEKETLTKIGESTELKVKIEPENADAQKLIWKSGDEMIAAVDENGKVTAIGNGTAIITVTTEDGKNTASITITVKIPDEPVINKTKGFGRLKVRSVNQTKTSITLEWSKLDGVDGYFVYGNRCNTKTKTYRYQKLATITNGRTWTHKNLKKGTFYKYIVKAYKIVDGKKVVTDTSASIHVITQGGKYGIAKSVSVTKIGNKKNVSKITLKKGKTAQITAKEIKKDKKIRHHRNLCYESSNTAVATVTPEGLIQAVGKGTCTIWVYAQNGVYAALTVTVK